MPLKQTICARKGFARSALQFSIIVMTLSRDATAEGIIYLRGMTRANAPLDTLH